VKFAYADPPYVGQARKHYGPEAREVNHPLLAAHLAEFDGFALSLSSVSLPYVLPLFTPELYPDGVRVGAWVKPFAIYKPGVNPGYCWEPVIFRPLPRKRLRTDNTVRDFVSANVTLRRGVSGAKPDAFCHWLFSLAGLQDDDEFVDLFPGSGAVTRALEAWRSQLRLTA
jgi:hypothetical protein